MEHSCVATTTQSCWSLITGGNVDVGQQVQLETSPGGHACFKELCRISAAAAAGLLARGWRQEC